MFCFSFLCGTPSSRATVRGMSASAAMKRKGEEALDEDGKRPKCDQEKDRSTAPQDAAAYRTVTVVRTQRDLHERLSTVATLTLGSDNSDGAQDASVFVCLEGVDSKPFLGVGGSFTEASAVVFHKMSALKQEEILKAYFDPKEGIGYSLGRISIASCDFGLGNWNCGNLKEGDKELRDFSIDHYEKAILPMLKRAAAKLKGHALTLMASPWSPPMWMKTKNKFNGDGHLLREYYSTWALHFVKFVKAMSEVGINIWAVSVQNEPEAAQKWESCIYTAEEERDFVRDHLGPAFEKAGLSFVKIIIWDHNRDGMLERAAVVYRDPEASKYVWGVGYHWYGDARFETWPERSEVPFQDRQKDFASIFELRARTGFDNVRKVADLGGPDKHIIFTEGCQELNGRPLKDILGDWFLAERYALNMIRDLNSGCEGWIDWNLCLDETGGPNHVGNTCSAPIICDTTTDQVLYQTSFYALGHFSKYIQRGARKLLSSTSRDVLEVVSFLNPDDSIVVVVSNPSGDAVSFWLKIGGVRAVETEAPSNSITTFVVNVGER